MKHNLKTEMKQSMDSLRFSPEEKNAMVYDLLAQAQQTKRKRSNGRKAVIIAFAACVALSLLTGAVVFTRWSATNQNRYKPSEEIKTQAENSGLSVVLDNHQQTQDPTDVLSVTDQGITVTAVQTIVDEYSADLTFRIEGFELPEGRDPAVWPVVTIDGEESDFSTSQSGDFFDGTTYNEQGKRVYLDGNPVRSDASGSTILDYTAEDGSMEYTHRISFQEKDGRYFGKTIQVQFPFIGLNSDQKAGLPERTVEGNWTLSWTLTGTADSIIITPNAQIGDSGVVLLDAQIGQRSIRTRYRVSDFWEGWDRLVELPQALQGVRMKDGSEHRCGGQTSGFEDIENMIYFIESPMIDAILDIDQVESLMFYEYGDMDANYKPIVPTPCYIPVSPD